MNNVKSVRSDEKVLVRFFNCTERDVDIIWVNFTGQYVRYRVIMPGGFLDVNTYKTHPWIALDAKTKDRLHIEKSFVYFPRGPLDYFPELAGRLPDRARDVRVRINVTLPVYSLRYRSLLEVRRLFRNAEEVDLLDLPKELIDDIKKSINYVKNQQILTLLQMG